MAWEENVLDGPNFVIRAIWARTNESAEWIAERMDVLLDRVSTQLKLGPWKLHPGDVWAGALSEKAELVRARAHDGSGQPQVGEGHALTALAWNAPVRIVTTAAAGSDRVGRRIPVHYSMLDVSPTGPGAVSPEQADAMVSAMVEAWSPLEVTLSTAAMNRAAGRSGWKIGSGYRLWVSDEATKAAEIAQTAGEITASRLHGGTLLSAPYEWDQQRVIDEMAQTRALNDIDIGAH